MADLRPRVDLGDTGWPIDPVPSTAPPSLPPSPPDLWPLAQLRPGDVERKPEQRGHDGASSRLIR
jgi:hypothetical protein